MATLLWPISNGRSSSRGQPFPSRARNLLRTIIPCLILHWWRAILRFLSAMLAPRSIFLILWNACFIDFFNLSDQITGTAEERAERTNRTNRFRQGRSLREEHRRDDGGDVVVVQCIPEDASTGGITHVFFLGNCFGSVWRRVSRICATSRTMLRIGGRRCPSFSGTGPVDG